MADSALSKELESLKEDLAALRSQRRSRSATADGETRKRQHHDPLPPPAAADEHHHLHGELRDLVKLITEYVEEAETNLAAHPTATVVGALMVGILIGRSLGRR
jgi:ElaB/YqjD/DUF883 family membrane-anchored ribosome-binding protein